MKDDLLEAIASVEWAESKLPAFEALLKSWLDNNIEISVVDTPGEDSWNVIVAREKGFLPLEFSAEAGAYINTIRSGLDILACAIGKREMFLHPDRAYFPVAGNAADFAAGNYRGAELVRHMSGDSRAIIENFHPYKGGNDTLWACHELDITRKHKRLLQAYIRPAITHIRGWGLSEIFKPVSIGIAYNPGEAMLGMLRKGAQCPEVHYTAQVCFNEASAAMPGTNVVIGIRGFAQTAKAIIGAFDF